MGRSQSEEGERLIMNSKFEIRKSEVEIRSSEFEIRNSMTGTRVIDPEDPLLQSMVTFHVLVLC